MRFIRKNGRVIPIRDGGSHSESYKKGYVATGVLTGAGLAIYSIGPAILQKGLQKGGWYGEHPGMFGGKGKLGLITTGVGVGLMLGAKANALYHTMQAPKGKRMEEFAKHAAVAAVGAKAGSVVAVGALAHQAKTVAESIHYAKTGRKIDINAKALYKAIKRLKSLGSGGGAGGMGPKLVGGK